MGATHNILRDAIAAKFHFAINVKKSKKMLEQRYHDYNEDRPRAERLKSGDLQLGFYLIEIAAAELRKEAFSGKLLPLQHLPFFRVSNPILAAKTGVTTRTVINRRNRLDQAGILTGYRWRTTNQKYDLRLSQSILYIQNKSGSENFNDWFYPRLDAPPGSPAYDEKFSSLCSLLTKPGLIKENEEEKGVVWDDIDHNYGLPPELVLKAGDTPEAKQPAGDTRQETDRPARKNASETPQKPKFDKNGLRSEAPRYWWQVTESLLQPDARKLEGIVSRLWSKCLHWNWYGTGQVVSSQQNLAKIRIGEWFTYYHPDCWKQLEGQLLKRLQLVESFIDHQEKEQKKVIWCPPPADYFDIRSKAKFSFTRTRLWYMKWRDRKQDTAAKAQLTKAKNRMKVAGYHTDPYAVEVEYGRSLEILAKYPTQIIHAFNDYVIQIYGSTTDLLP